MERVLHLVRLEQRNLARDVTDYATWDDMYEYVQNRNQQFRTSNFVPNLFADSRLNLLLVLNLEGEVIYRGCRDYRASQDLDFAEFGGDRISLSNPLFRDLPQHRANAGLMWSSRGLLLVAARPILKSDASGEPRGFVVMGRLWDDAELADLGDTMQLPVAFQPAHPPGAGLLAVPNQLRFTKSAHTVDGTCLLADIHGEPSILLRVALPRAMFRLAVAGWLWSAVCIAFVALASGLGFYLIVERIVLHRVELLDRVVADVSRQQNPGLAIPNLGQDELGRLAQQIQTMLTSLHLSRQTLAVNETRYREFLEHFPGIAYQHTLDGKWRLFHGAVAPITGYLSDQFLAGRTRVRELILPEDLPAYDQAEFANDGRGGVEQQREYRIRHQDATVRYLLERFRVVMPATGGPAYVEGIIHDVTAQKQVEAQLRQSQTLEAIGLLTSGIAHDFNNVLQGILGHAGIATKACTRNQPDKAAEHLEIVRQAATRGASLVENLLTFCRRRNAAVESVPLNELVVEVAAFLRRTLPRNIALETVLDPLNPAVRANRSQLQQAMLNLCLNARDAMPEGGKLTLRSALSESDNAPPLATLQVRDTGQGMTDDVQKRMFEPFFTTKAPGTGTGLGLPMVYGTVKSAGGSIACESAPGKGIIFTLCFPLATPG